MTIVHSPGFRHLAFCWETPSQPGAGAATRKQGFAFRQVTASQVEYEGYTAVYYGNFVPGFRDLPSNTLLSRDCWRPTHAVRAPTSWSEGQSTLRLIGLEQDRPDWRK